MRPTPRVANAGARCWRTVVGPGGAARGQDAAARYYRRAVLMETSYKGYRIEVNAELADGAWDAQVRIRRVLSEEVPHVELVTCRKPTAKVAEERAAVYARRWVDQHGATT